MLYMAEYLIENLGWGGTVSAVAACCPGTGDVDVQATKNDRCGVINI